MAYFTEAPIPSQQQQQMQQQPAIPPQQQQDELGVNPPEAPPDFTNGGGYDQNQQMMDPNQQMMQGDPNQQMLDPNQQAPQEGDPNQDPNAAGEEIAADPAAVQGPEDEIKQSEQDVFSDLSPEQMIIKNSELKEQYRTLHSILIDSIDKINKISHTTYDDSMLDFIVKKMVTMKTMIRDTLIDAFPTRTYVENKIELQRFIMVYNQLANMISAVYQSRIKRQEKIAQMNNTDKNSRDPEEFPLFTRGYDVQ
jgi:hypothetical protein